MSAVRGLIAKLAGLRDEVTTPRVFYAAHREAWLELARRTVRDTLVNLRPDKMDAEAWARQVELAVGHVSVHLLELEDAGLIIRLNSETAEGEDTADVAQRFGFTLEEIRQWVEDGRAGEKGAKRIDERDVLKSDLQIAWRIIYTLKFNKPGADGLRAALNKYFGAAAGTATAELYPEVLKAWAAVFTVQAGADWRQWISSRVRAVELGAVNRFGI